MAENPFLQLYPGDYFAKTRHFNNCQHGAYLLMIMTAWMRKDGALPDDDEFLAKITCLTIRKWKAIKPSIMEFWYVENGYLFNERIAEDRKKLAVKAKSLSDSGKKGVEAKKAKLLKSNGVASSHPSISKQPPLSILEPELYKEEYTSKSELQFEEFWDVFAYKNGRAPALKSWMKISGYDDAMFVQILAGAKRDAAARPDIIANGGTPKMAQGWITDRRWEDEVTPGFKPSGMPYGSGQPYQGFKDD